MWLSIHSLLSPSTSKRTPSVPALAATIAELRVLCKILIIISTDVVKHRTLTTIRMITYLVHVRVIRAPIMMVWMPVRVCPMLASSLTLSLLLKHLLRLVWLLLACQRGVWGRITTGLSFCSLSVTGLGLCLGSACWVLRALLCSGGAESASSSLLRCSTILCTLLRLLAVISIVAVVLISIPLVVRSIIGRHVIRSG